MIRPSTYWNVPVRNALPSSYGLLADEPQLERLPGDRCDGLRHLLIALPLKSEHRDTGNVDLHCLADADQLGRAPTEGRMNPRVTATD